MLFVDIMVLVQYSCFNNRGRHRRFVSYRGEILTLHIRKSPVRVDIKRRLSDVVHTSSIPNTVYHAVKFMLPENDTSATNLLLNDSVDSTTPILR